MNVLHKECKMPHK